MYRLQMFGTEYEKELDVFIEVAENYIWNNKLKRICCPCKERRNLRMWDDPRVIRQQLTLKCFMANYTCWIMHGEKDTGKNHIVADDPVVDHVHERAVQVETGI